MSFNDFDHIETNNAMAGWVGSLAFNASYFSSITQNQLFYQVVPGSYREFAMRHVRNWLYWSDGYVPYLHNTSSGIVPSGIGSSIVDILATKVKGSRIFFKSAGKVDSDQTEALSFISLEWAEKSKFHETIDKAIRFACAGGTSLIKLNRDDNGLWAEALRFDSFTLQHDARGNLHEVKVFIDAVSDGLETTSSDHYMICEHRYFIDREPWAEFKIYKSWNDKTRRSYDGGEQILFKNLPKNIRSSIGKNFADAAFDKPIRLPFVDSLGCELVKWTTTVTGLPNLHFGESGLHKILTELASWEYYYSSFNTDMYTGRARVLVPSPLQKAGNNQGRYYQGLDDYTYTKIPSLSPENYTPTPIQFDLRAEEWKRIKDMLLENMALKLGINVSTLASHLNDSSVKTAREVSTEENQTAAFVDSKRALIEKPLNRVIKTVLRYTGFADNVEIRWSQAGLTNRQSLTEIIALGKQAGFISTQKAVEMFSYDDDIRQQEEELERLKKEYEQGASSLDDFDWGELEDEAEDRNSRKENQENNTGSDLL